MANVQLQYGVLQYWLFYVLRSLSGKVQKQEPNQKENKESYKTLEGVYSCFCKLCFVGNGVGSVTEVKEVG